jgi:N-acylneuraminate cytidylyltransferase
VKVAIIPARGGSKRIPGKNIRAFAGKPIIAYAIDCARASGLFERVLVSTDDARIAQAARGLGAEAPFLRPPALSDDHADTRSVIAHALGFLAAEGTPVSAACCIYATAAFVDPADLRRGLELLEAGDLDFVFSAASFPAPVQRGFTADAQGGVRMLFPEHAGTRSQDLPEVLHDAAQFYWGRPSAWLGTAPIFGARSAVVRIPRWRVQDIDTEEDWIQAEAMMSVLRGRP